MKLQHICEEKKILRVCNDVKYYKTLVTKIKLKNLSNKNKTEKPQ